MVEKWMVNFMWGVRYKDDVSHIMWIESMESNVKDYN